MRLSETTFGYLDPTDEQKEVMQTMRDAAAAYARMVEQHVPAGPDQTFILRNIRTNAMWINVAITRDADGSPRGDFVDPRDPNPELPVSA